MLGLGAEGWIASQACNDGLVYRGIADQARNDGMLFESYGSPGVRPLQWFAMTEKGINVKW